MGGFALVAQWIEYCPPKARVVGSNPAERARNRVVRKQRPLLFTLTPPYKEYHLKSNIFAAVYSSFCHTPPMLAPALLSLFGSANERAVKAFKPLLIQTSALAEETALLSDADIKETICKLQQQRQQGTPLDTLLPRTFALVREAATRTLRQTHFDVQIIGGITLHKGNIAEMKTGEGKTLVATLPAALNALDRKGVHIVTVNDYLAKRDAAWMGRVFDALGLSTGCIHADLNDAERRQQYNADITYGTNNELGFDFLRDNLKLRNEERAQRDFHYAIVDEVDSILIDEARTPLIISGPAQRNIETYNQIDRLVVAFRPEHYEKDEKQRVISLTEEGSEVCENLVREKGLVSEGTLYDLHNISLVHQITQALKAQHLFHKDTDYIVKDRQVLIIDEFTGRIMEGRRYSDGLHQAIEAKEGVPVQNENQTLASITFQNYFRNYTKLAGMTGTAMTEAAEFFEIYGLNVVSIDTHKTMCRKDENDEIYRTRTERDKAVVRQIQHCHQTKQPVLIGTVSIEKSEALSQQLKKARVPHQVLNARRHAQEARIIEQAGRSGGVTIATNMAGRGTDIQLGDNTEAMLARCRNEAEREKTLSEVRNNAEQVRNAGGLYILGTERHESRRIDNQLRGRAGRQGDPGQSKFFLSLEDDLMRIFGSKRLDGMLQKLGIRPEEAISHPWVNKAIEKAQKKVEEQNFEVRKQLLKFDDVTNDQRKIVFAQRRAFMNEDEAQSELIEEFRKDLLDTMVARAIPERAMAEQWNLEGLHEEVLRLFALDLPIEAWAKEEGVAEEDLKKRIADAVQERTGQQRAQVSEALMQEAERALLLQVQDALWKDHLAQLDHLRQGIGLRSYGQQDPLNAYRKEAFDLFESMLWLLKENVVALLSRLTFDLQHPLQSRPAQARRHPSRPYPRGEGMREGINEGINEGMNEEQKRNGAAPSSPIVKGEKVRRNAPCPCGSGKKYKHCCGRLA